MEPQEFASDIVEAIKGLSPTQKEEIAEGLARYFWTNQRSRAMQDVRNQIAPRILVSGNEINKDAAGNPVGFGNTGKSQFPVVNFVGATGAVNSSVNGVQADVTTGGGGADCMFDFLVSSCFSSLAGFTEGQTFTSLSGCTFRGYSTWQGVMTYLDANSTSGGSYTIYLCGITSESVSLTYPASRWNKLFVYGNGAAHSGITGTLSLAGTEGTSYNTQFFDIQLPTVAATSGNAHHPKFYRCAMQTVSAVAGTGYDGLLLDECLVTTSIDGSTGGEWNNTTISNCIISGFIDLGGNSSASNCMFSNNQMTGTGSYIKILASSAANSSDIIGNVWHASGTDQTTSQIIITGVSPIFGIKIVGNHFRAPNTTAVNPISVTANGYVEMAIVGNTFSYDGQHITPFISGASGAPICATITGNAFTSRTGGPVYIEDDGGVSISGTFINSSFGLNTPSKFAVTLLTGSSNNIYIGTGTVTGTGATQFPSSADPFVTIGNVSDLSAERALTAGNNITVTDGGANSTVTIAARQDHLYAAVVDGSTASTTVPFQVIGPFPRAATIVNVYAKCDENKTIGATSWIGDIHKILAANQDSDGQGTTVYTTQANRPTIANTHMATTATAPDVTAVAAGDWLAFYTDQVGTNATFITMAVSVTYP